MKNKTYLNNILILVVACICVSCISCSANKKAIENKNNYSNNGSKYKPAGFEKNITSDMAGAPTYAYSPLTLSKFQAIRDGTDQLSKIFIDYSTYLNDDELGHPLNIRFFSLTGGDLYNNRYYNSISEYSGRLMNDDRTIPRYEVKEKEFLPVEVELILDYLKENEENIEYFFNGDEYQGLPTPYLTQTTFINKKRYNFILIIFEPDGAKSEYDAAWAISKSVDEPDTIFQGLINRLENNFINQFE